MPFKFGAAVTDNILFNGQVPTTMQLANRVILQMGWVYPTTLTAGRHIFSSAGTHGLKIHTTTTDLAIVADYATTDGLYTAPAGLTVNDWHFVAWLSAWGSLVANAQKLFVGNGVRGFPTERVVTQATAPVGALTGGGSSWRLGNDNAATANAFQGSMSGCYLMIENASSDVSAFGFSGAPGTLTQVQTDMMFRRFVVPYWRNNLSEIIAPGRHAIRFQTTATVPLGSCIICSLDNAGGTSANAWYLGGTTFGWSPPNRATVTGATSDTVVPPPRVWDDTPWPVLNPPGRGVARGYRPRVIVG